MEINQDKVPATIEQAVAAVVAGLSQSERDFIRSHPNSTRVHFSVGMSIRNSWSLWEKDSPLKRDAVAKYQIAHADDISGLINAWVWARVRDEEFDPIAHCQGYHEHWRQYGTDSLSAGGWERE